MKKSVVIIICLVIAALIGTFFLGSETPSEEGLWKDATYLDDTTMGEGEKTIFVEVVAEEKSVAFEIHTDKDTVGDALSEHNLIDGDKGPYGLYVKYVNGIKADYDTDKAYWALNKGGAALTTGVDQTEIEDGAHYELVYTK